MFKIDAVRAVAGWGIRASAACLVVGGGGQTVRGGLVVLQTEATNAGRYSSVNFDGNLTVTGALGSEFEGLRFRADSGFATDGNDVSGHAAEVGGHFYGLTSPARPYVSEVRLMNDTTFLSQYVRPIRRNGSVGPPVSLPGRPVVVNASFAGSSQFFTVDADYLRRLDLLTARDGTLVVAGSVTNNTGGFDGATLVWGAQNVLSVRGSATESVFNPSANVVGKRYTNVWNDGTASTATGDVSSVATELIGRARQIKRASAAKSAPVRAAIMAAANRTATVLNVSAWHREQANGLDTDLGAGRLDGPAARAILEAPAVKFQNLSTKTLTLKGPYSLDPSARRTRAVSQERQGLASDVSLRPGQVWVSLVRLVKAVRGVTAALVWNTSARTGNTGDLRLELRPVSITSRGDASLNTTPLISVDAQDDNIRFTGYDQTIAAGLYAWFVVNEGSEAVSPGFAYRFGADVIGTTTGIEANLLSGESVLDPIAINSSWLGNGVTQAALTAEVTQGGLQARLRTQVVPEGGTAAFVALLGAGLLVRRRGR